MNLRIVPMAVALILLAPALRAAELVCGNVNDDARTYYSSSSAAAKTVNGKTCTISIDGATAATAAPAPYYWAAYCGAVVRFPASDPKVYVREIVLSIASASIPGMGLDAPVDDMPSPDKCSALLADAAARNDQLFKSDLHSQMDGKLDDLVACLRGETRPGVCEGGPDIGGGAIKFSSSFGEHTVFLPQH